jgi:formamidopyrimidine-DNA glycosylase
MPELPEVETIRTGLEPKLLGRRFEDVEILDSRLTRPLDPAEVAAELTGERVAAVDRRGKYLIVRFESGLVLLIHLRMTGNLAHSRNGASEASPHLRAVVRLDDGSDVTYRDVRRFGTWVVLGPAFSGRGLRERLARRRGPVKGVLLDQRMLAGVGNIYADEALWRARIDPRRPANELQQAEIGALHRGIRRALEAGIARQGATLRDYRTPDGDAGGMQHEFKVYGRGGEPCSRCGTLIEKTRGAGRGTWFCPACQR